MSWLYFKTDSMYLDKFPLLVDQDALVAMVDAVNEVGAVIKNGGKWVFEKSFAVEDLESVGFHIMICEVLQMSHNGKHSLSARFSGFPEVAKVMVTPSK